jgi:hypothetical protein
VFIPYSAVLEEHRKQCEMEGKYVGKCTSTLNISNRNLS